MTYALTIGSRDGIADVICAECRCDIGTMRLNDVLRAIVYRGPILCLNCRSRHCDYCGHIGKWRLGFASFFGTSGHWRICKLCIQQRRSRDLPACTRTVVSFSGRELAANETMVRTEGLT